MVAAIAAEFTRYKALAEAAIEQLSDSALSQAGPGDGNGITELVWHVAGNLESRFTDFRTSDGEKPWRNRDDEFSARTVSRTELLEKWGRGWRALQQALDALTDADANQSVTIRGQALRIEEALYRSLAHTAYHVGQIVYLAKALRGAEWQCLSIPRGASTTYRQQPGLETPEAHARDLDRRRPPGQ